MISLSNLSIATDLAFHLDLAPYTAFEYILFFMDLAVIFNYILAGIAFIVIFSILIIIHEFGHFYAAIKSGVKVEEFGLGMGKKLYGYKKGEVEYTLNIFPFGGFVRMLGEEAGQESADPRSFGQASLWRRMIITLAGIFMNFVLAIVLLTGLFSVGTDPILISEKEVVNAYESGLLQIELSDGTRVTRKEARALPGDTELKMVYTEQIKLPVYQALPFAFAETYRISGAVLDKAAEIPRELFMEMRVPEGLAGPVGIADITHSVLPQGLGALIKLMALLSISLAVMNLLPIPALDGGRFLFQIIEMILMPFGIKPNEKIENYVHLGGFILLMGLIVLITWNDITRIFF